MRLKAAQGFWKIEAITEEKPWAGLGSPEGKGRGMVGSELCTWTC